VERFGGEDRPTPEATIDYRRKRGMLEEINRAARDIEEEESEEDKMRLKLNQRTSGPLEQPQLPTSTGLEEAPAGGGEIPGAARPPAATPATPTPATPTPATPTPAAPAPGTVP
jgi:hypothetical protein